MHVFEELPAELQTLVVEYKSLPELIEARVPLTHRRLINIVRVTLGDAYTTESTLELSRLVSDIGLCESHNEGYTALLLLGRLQPHLVQRQRYTYFASQHPSFKRVVYPPLISLIQQSDEQDLELLALGTAESTMPPNMSGLDLLYDLVGTKILACGTMYQSVTANPQFILNHIDEIAITDRSIYIAVRLGNLALAETFLKQLRTHDNLELLRTTGLWMFPSEIASLNTFLQQSAPALQPLLQGLEELIRQHRFW